MRRRELLSRPGTIVSEITLDHRLLMSSYDTASERALASSALERHGGSGLRVLVGGLGLGYTVREVCSRGGDRISRVEVLEYLPQVLDWAERDLLPLAAELRADGRVSIAQGDIYASLLAPPTESYDLILVDVDHAPDDRLTDQSAAFYTEPGLRSARAHLAEGGVLAVWSYAQSSPFADALSAVFSDVSALSITVWNDLVDEEQTDWLFLARA